MQPKLKENYNSGKFEPFSKFVPISISHNDYAFQQNAPQFMPSTNYSNTSTLQKKSAGDTMV